VHVAQRPTAIKLHALHARMARTRRLELVAVLALWEKSLPQINARASLVRQAMSLISKAHRASFARAALTRPMESSAFCVQSARIPTHQEARTAPRAVRGALPRFLAPRRARRAAVACKRIRRGRSARNARLASIQWPMELARHVWPGRSVALAHVRAIRVLRAQPTPINRRASRAARSRPSTPPPKHAALVRVAARPTCLAPVARRVQRDRSVVAMAYRAYHAAAATTQARALVARVHAQRVVQATSRV
jgi:hypothetical protein